MNRPWLLAEASRIGLEPHGTGLDKLRAPVSYRTSADNDKAVQALELQVNDRCGQLSSARKLIALQGGKARNRPTYPDFRNALIVLVGEGAAGALDVLLERFVRTTDVLKPPKRSVLQRRRSIAVDDREQFAGALIDQSWQIRDASTTEVLTRYSDAKHIQDLLHSALEDGAVDFIEIALISGADPNKEIPLFKDAVLRGDRAIVRLLLSAPTTLSAESKSEALTEAVRTRNLSIVRVLLVSGANVDIQDAEAFGLAVKSRLNPFIILMLLAQRPPSPENIDRILKERLGTRQTLGQDQPLFEILVQGGANGDGLSALLIAAASDGNVNFCRLLVQKNPSLQYNEGQAFKVAMEKSDLDILHQLQCLELGPGIATSLLGKMTYEKDKSLSPSALAIMSMLLAQGAQGESVGKLLQERVRLEDEPAIRQLLCHDASVSYGGGAALQEAIKNENQQLVRLLLQQNPDSKTLGLAIKQAVHISNLDCLRLLVQGQKLSIELIDIGLHEAMRLPITDQRRPAILDILLDAGASKREMSNAILHELRELIKMEDSTTYTLEKLISHGADIDHHASESLQIAVSSGQVILVQTLLNARPCQKSIDAAFVKFGLQPNRQTHLEVIKALLGAGVSQCNLDAALVLATSSRPPDEKFLRDLIHFKASVDFDHGRAICHAVELPSDNMDLLKFLLQQSPSYGTLTSAWEKSLSLHDKDTRLQVWEQLLSAGMHGPPVDSALVRVFQEKNGSYAHTAIALLLRYSSSVDFDNGAALRCAMKSRDSKLLMMVLAANPSIETLARCMLDTQDMSGNARYDLVCTLIENGAPEISSSRLLASTTGESTEDLRLVHLLLDRGASVHFNNSQCLREAAMRCHHRTLNLLLSKISSSHEGLLSEIFSSVFNAGNHGQDEPKYLILQSLLKSGVRGRVLCEVLVKATSESSNRWCRALIGALLDADVDVTWANGKALHLAVSNRSYRTVRQLLQREHSNEVMSSAIQTLVADGRDEEVPDIVKILDEFQAAPYNVNVSRHYLGFKDPLVKSLGRFSNPSEILTRLIALGSSVNSELTFAVLPNQGNERGSLLCWAICNDFIQDSTLVYLIEHGAKVHASTSCSLYSPLILSALKSRRLCLQKLIEANANIRWVDKSGNTALCYSSRVGDVDMSRSLVLAESQPNDGSLHEAVRHLHIEVARLLLENDHSPNKCLSKSDGRSALAELCLKVNGSAPKSLLRDMVQLLLDNGADRRQAHGGKSILLFAFDNANPLVATEVILDLCMQECVNDEFNLYHYNQHVYSPVEYVRRGLSLAPKSQANKLVSVLEMFSCKSVYYATHVGAQPEDFCGAPTQIYEREMALRQQREEERRQRELRQQKIDDEMEDAARREKLQERAAAKRQTILQTEHMLALAQSHELAETELKQDHARNQSTLDYQAATHNQKMLQSKEIAANESAARDKEDSRHQRMIEFEGKERRRTIEAEGAAHSRRNREARDLIEFETRHIQNRHREQRNVTDGQLRVVGENRRLLEAQQHARAVTDPIRRIRMREESPD